MQRFVRGFALVLCLRAGVGLAAGGAVAVPSTGDVAGKGSGQAIADAVAQALSAAQVPTAGFVATIRAAKAAKVKPLKGLKISQAAELAAKGHFAAVVIARKHKKGALVELVTAGGQVTIERVIHVNGTSVDPTDVAGFATAVAQALGGAPPPAAAPPANAESAPSDDGATAAPSQVVTSSTASDAPEPGSVYSGPEAGSHGSASGEPAAGFFARFALYLGPGERLFLTPGFSYLTSYPYLQGGVSVELYPFRAFALGLVADFSLGIVQDELASQAGTFNSTDIRVDVALAYRLRLSGPYGTIFTPKVGFGMRQFDAPSSAGLPGDDRIFLVAGVDITQPIIPRYLHIGAGIAALPFSNLGSAGQTAYGASSAFGLSWNAELGGDIVGGLEWALRVDQERFMDSYSGPPSASGIDIYTAYTVQLRYHL